MIQTEWEHCVVYMVWLTSISLRQPAFTAQILLRYLTSSRCSSRAGDLDLELLTKPIPRKLGFLSAIGPLSDSISFLSNVVIVKVDA